MCVANTLREWQNGLHILMYFLNQNCRLFNKIPLKCQPWFRLWLGTMQAASLVLTQWWPSSLMYELNKFLAEDLTLTISVAFWFTALYKTVSPLTLLFNKSVFVPTAASSSWNINRTETICMQNVSKTAKIYIHSIYICDTSNALVCLQV